MRAALLGVLIFLSTPVYAYDAGTELPIAAQEAQARDLFHELRCMVCQNQSIADSDAPLARDLRALVRERVAAGDSDDAIKAFLVARYGQFVLLKPRLEAETLLLWGTPFAVFFLGAGTALIAARRRRKPLAVQDKLTPSEKSKLDALMGRDA